MSLKVTGTSGGGDFVPAPEGTHTARCVQVIELGTQYSEFYKKASPKVLIGWELPKTLDDDGEPFLVWKRYTASLHENAALRKDLEGWRGKLKDKEILEGFDLSSILDTPCFLNIVHNDSNGKTYANVASVIAIPPGAETPDRFHDLVHFDLDLFLAGENSHRAAFDTFSENLKKTIGGSEEMKEEVPI